MIEQKNVNRREAIRLSVTGLAAVSLGGFTVVVQAEQVSESDELAVSLNYKHDASKAEGRSDDNAYCKNCAFFTGGDAEWGPCSIFNSNEVNANGWCVTYSAKQ